MPILIPEYLRISPETSFSCLLTTITGLGNGSGLPNHTSVLNHNVFAFGIYLGIYNKKRKTWNTLHILHSHKQLASHLVILIITNKTVIRGRVLGTTTTECISTTRAGMHLASIIQICNDHSVQPFDVNLVWLLGPIGDKSFPQISRDKSLSCASASARSVWCGAVRFVSKAVHNLWQAEIGLRLHFVLVFFFRANPRVPFTDGRGQAESAYKIFGFFFNF